MDYNQVIAAAINSVLVLIAVQFIKAYALPWIQQEFPFVLPILAIIIGPLLAMFTDYLANLLGYPIDLSPISGLFSGGTAVALHQIYNQRDKGLR